jgi:hypothetical protein
MLDKASVKPAYPVVVILDRFALKHPEGPLFRNSNGNPWTRQRRLIIVSTGSAES